MSDEKPANPLVLSLGQQISPSEIGLRDLFAAVALQGLITAFPDSDASISGFAADAYRYADAMLAERERKR